MITKKEELRLQNFVEKIIKSNGKGDYDAFQFDVHSEIDRKLDVAQNKVLLLEKINATFPKDIHISVDELKPKYDVLEKKKEHLEKQELVEKEYTAEKEFEKSLQELLKEKNKDKIINEIFKIPIEYIKSVAEGYHNSFIFTGLQGTGKTTTTLQVLEKNNADYCYHSGISTPKSLYEFLFQNRDGKIIVFDDCAGLINNSYAVSILLSALWSPTNKRIVNWNTSVKVKSIPNKFIFNSKIIVITNKIPNNEYAKIVMSRCLLFNLELSHKNKIKLMYAIGDKEVVDFLKKYSSEATQNFDLRLLRKAEKFKEYSKNWEELIKPMLSDIDEELDLLKKCLRKENSIKQAEREWILLTNKSRRSFYRKKKLLE